MNDLRHAVRRLFQDRGFTLAAVLSLGLGIGANTTLYTWVKGVLLDPLPGVRDVGSLVFVNGTDPRLGVISLSYPDYLEYRKSPAVAGMAAQDELAVTLAEGDRADRVWGQVVSENFFEVLGVGPAAGRTFGSADGLDPGRVAVLSHAFWRSRFGGDPSVVGRAVRLNTVPFTIIGVAAPGFQGGEVGLAMDVFVPVTTAPALMGRDGLNHAGNRWLQGLARVPPGSSPREVEAGLQVTARQIASASAGNRDAGIAVSTFLDPPVGGGKELGPVLRVLAVVVGVVLLIACANVAGLLLARGAGRRREIAVRLSLGATRGRVVRQLLLESLVLAALGGLAGLVVASWGAPLLLAFAPPTDLPIAIRARLDTSALAFACALSLVTAVVFGLAPALQSTRPDVLPVLRDEASSVVGGTRRARFRGALVAVQVALSLLLLVSAGLLVRSLRNALGADVGFDTRRVAMASIDLVASGYDATTGRTFVQEALARIRALPGVRSATVTRRAPLGFGGRSSSTFRVEGYEAPPDRPAWAFVHTAGPDYVKTLGARLVAGRDITASDTRDAPRVALVGETTARRYWAGRDPLGGRVDLGGDVFTVVGVVRDIQHHRVNEGAAPHLYLPFLQAYRPTVTFLVRTEGDAAAMGGSVAATLRGMDRTLPVFNVTTLDSWIRAATFQQRMAMSFLSGFGVLALLLAVVGLYGLQAYTVGQRTREIGIRMALGGARRDIFALVVRQGLALVALGVALGLVATWAATQPLRALLVGVPPFDPATYAGVALVLVAVATLAAAIPARRASTVDPARALRHE